MAPQVKGSRCYASDPCYFYSFVKEKRCLVPYTEAVY